jgi:hypothetical protein
MERDTPAFVVWIEGDSGRAAADGSLQGRVEHLQTSARASFSSVDELLRFLTTDRRPDGRAGSDR